MWIELQKGLFQVTSVRKPVFDKYQNKWKIKVGTTEIDTGQGYGSGTVYETEYFYDEKEANKRYEELKEKIMNNIFDFTGPEVTI